MRKENPTRYSSAVCEAWIHFSFKVKYCHNIFDDFGVRNATKALLLKACRKYSIPHKEIGFDSNHVHGIIDLNNYNRPKAKLFKLFPWIKKKYFWGSGLWNPTYFIGGVGKDIKFMQNYVLKQKYAKKDVTQMKLVAY